MACPVLAQLDVGKAVELVQLLFRKHDARLGQQLHGLGLHHVHAGLRLLALDVACRRGLLQLDHLQLQLALIALRLGLRLHHLALAFRLLENRISLHLGHLRLCLLHLGLGQLALRLSQRRRAIIALLPRHRGGFLGKLVNLGVHFTAHPERCQRELDQRAAQFSPGRTSLCQANNRLRSRAEGAQELGPAGLLGHIVRQNRAVRLDLDHKAARPLVPQKLHHGVD
jgi:hypothetical protein